MMKKLPYQRKQIHFPVLHWRASHCPPTAAFQHKKKNSIQYHSFQKLLFKKNIIWLLNTSF